MPGLTVFLRSVHFRPRRSSDTTPLQVPLVFDTLAYARHLAGAGVPEEQAAAHAQALAAAIGEDMVTRRDLEPLATKAELHAVEERIEKRIAELERRMEIRFARMEVGFASLETRLTVRFGAIVVAALGAMSAIVKLL